MKQEIICEYCKKVLTIDHARHGPGGHSSLKKQHWEAEHPKEYAEIEKALDEFRKLRDKYKADYFGVMAVMLA